MKYNNILAKLSYLRSLLFHPEWVDGPGPHDPQAPFLQLPEFAVDLFLAENVRNLARLVHAGEVSRHLHALGDRFAATALDGLRSRVENGDDIDLCPPYLPHGPRPRSPLEWVALNPQPLPPGPDPYSAPGAGRDVLIAFALREIAGLTTHGDFSREIFAAGQSLIRASATRAVDDYCGTPVPHRVPVPHRG